jgi:hypothetical protein
MKMARTHTKTAEIVKINQLLTEHCHKGENGLYNYDKDWSDDRIAKEVNPNLQRTQVGKIRLELFGAIQPTVGENTIIKELRTKIDELNTRLHELENLHAKLCSSLTINKISDVKHLTGRGETIRALK